MTQRVAIPNPNQYKHKKCLTNFCLVKERKAEARLQIFLLTVEDPFTLIPVKQEPFPYDIRPYSSEPQDPLQEIR